MTTIGALAARNAEIIAAVRTGEKRSSIAKRFRVHGSVMAKLCRDYEAATGETLPMRQGSRPESDAPHPPCTCCGGPVGRRDELHHRWLARKLCTSCLLANRQATVRAANAKRAAERAAEREEPEVPAEQVDAPPPPDFSAHNVRTRDFGSVRGGRAATIVPGAVS